MNDSTGGAWKIGSVMGIPIRLHFTWFVVFGLITWSLSTVYFPSAAPDLPAAAYWVKGALASLLLFASVAFHELAHSFVAKRYKMVIEHITLFIFGGVAQMKGEPPHPEAEFRIAVAGPLSSFFLAAVFFYATLNTSGGVRALFAYVAQINLVLALFNLIPGFPMDGGRVLRSFLWKRKKNFFYATQKASGVGQKIALFFIFLGIFSLFTGMSGGLWLLLIGWFLYSAAKASYQQAGIQEILDGVKVRHIFLDEAVSGYFLRYGFGGFPVVENGRYLGMLTLKELKDVPREATLVSAVYAPHKAEWEVLPDEDAVKALERMIRGDVGRLVVTSEGRIEGLITRSGIARYVQLMGRSGGAAGLRELEA
jgi:Zn-dependent protease